MWEDPIVKAEKRARSYSLALIMTSENFTVFFARRNRNILNAS